MRLPLTTDLREALTVRRYVAKGRGPVRRYLMLGGGFLVMLSDRQVVRFGRSLARDARRITDRDLEFLLGFEWRSSFTAAWLVGLGQRTHFRDRLGELLMQGRSSHSGAGYCFALARFGEDDDAEILTAYLDRYLSQPDCEDAQASAIGALLHLDDRRGTDHAARFLGELWAGSAVREQDPIEQKQYMDELCAFADSCMTGRLKEWLPRRRRFVDQFWD